MWGKIIANKNTLSNPLHEDIHPVLARSLLALQTMLSNNNRKNCNTLSTIMNPWCYNTEIAARALFQIGMSNSNGHNLISYLSHNEALVL